MAELQEALANVKRSSRGLLPIRSYGKCIRDGSTDWHELESYVSARTNAHVSREFCPSCFDRLAVECGSRPCYGASAVPGAVNVASSGR